MAVNKRKAAGRGKGVSKPASAQRAAHKEKTVPSTGFISDLDCYLFGAGTHYDIYQKLGAIPRPTKGKKASISASGPLTPRRFTW